MSWGTIGKSMVVGVRLRCGRHRYVRRKAVVLKRMDGVWLRLHVTMGRMWHGCVMVEVRVCGRGKRRWMCRRLDMVMMMMMNATAICVGGAMGVSGVPVD